jgi:hypothetical protein
VTSPPRGEELRRSKPRQLDLRLAFAADHDVLVAGELGDALLLGGGVDGRGGAVQSRGGLRGVRLFFQNITVSAKLFSLCAMSPNSSSTT